VVAAGEDVVDLFKNQRTSIRRSKENTMPGWSSNGVRGLGPWVLLLATMVLLLAMGSVAVAETPDVPDTYPGIPVPASPVTGDIGVSGDYYDVYNKILAEGDTIVLHLVGWTAIDFLTPLGPPPYLRLQPPGSTLGGPVLGAATLSYPYSYTVPAGGAGPYYLVLAYNGGAGRYTFAYTVTPAGGGAGGGEELSESGSVSVSANVDAAPPSLTFSISPGVAPAGGSVSATSIDFGTLVPDTPKTGSHILSVTTNSESGYMVTAGEDRPLTSGLNLIPDVLGDDGSVSELVPGPWSLATTYGFGFTLTGSDAGFSSGYKQFADASAGEPAQPIMANTADVTASEVEVGYKVNIGSTQPSGNYTNTISYVATANF
jgi:hypothetical protein